jgi:quercetin dioxygenase-like cupin family protein
MITTTNKRVFENPLIKDKVTFLQTSTETSGAYTLVEVELAAGGGNGLHAHTSFNEEFIPLEGILGIEVGKKKWQLKPGESAAAQPGDWHRFYNPGNAPIRFQVKLTPGSEGFEKGLKIAYGLADDGETNNKGIPKRLEHIALLTTMTDTLIPGIFSVIQPLLRWKAKKAIEKGIDQQLINKYC